METLLVLKKKFGSSRVARKVSEYLAGSKLIWLKKYRFVLKNGKGRLRHSYSYRSYFHPLEIELRQAGLQWRLRNAERK